MDWRGGEVLDSGAGPVAAGRLRLAVCSRTGAVEPRGQGAQPPSLTGQGRRCGRCRECKVGWAGRGRPGRRKEAGDAPSSGRRTCRRCPAPCTAGRTCQTVGREGVGGAQGRRRGVRRRSAAGLRGGRVPGSCLPACRPARTTARLLARPPARLRASRPAGRQPAYPRQPTQQRWHPTHPGLLLARVPAVGRHIGAAKALQLGGRGRRHGRRRRRHGHHKGRGRGLGRRRRRRRRRRRGAAVDGAHAGGVGAARALGQLARAAGGDVGGPGGCAGGAGGRACGGHVQ